MTSLTLACALLFAAPPDATATRRQEAAGHYSRALQLYKAADYAAAAAEFRAAYEAAPSFEVLFNLGLAERRLFKYGQALETFQRYLKEGGARVPANRRDDVDDELAQIKRLTAPVAIEVVGPPARVSVDGESLGDSPLANVVLLGPGRHVVRAEREGFSPDERTLDVVAGRASAVQLEPRSLTAPVPVTVEATPAGAQVTLDGKPAGAAPLSTQLSPGTHELLATREGYAPSRSDVLISPGQPRALKLVLVRLPRTRPFPTLATSLLAGGALSLGAGIYFTARAQELSRQVTTLGEDFGQWNSAWAARDAEGRRANVLAWITLVGGGVAATSGIVALAAHFGTPEGDPDGPSATVAFTASPSGTLGFSCTGHF